MNSLEAGAAIFGLLLVLSVLSGIIFSALGRPLNVALSAIHKLVADCCTCDTS